jgi:hypothetical protein
MANSARATPTALLVVIGVLFSGAISAQPSSPPQNTPAPVPSSPGTAKPIPPIAASGGINTPTTSTPDTPSVSDAAAFLLGSGLALLIALLAWGEQIRAITRDTRDLERDFLDATDLSRAQLSALLQAKNDDERLHAFTNLMASGKLTTAPQVEILPLFERWRFLGDKLRRLQSWKYWLTVSLTLVFLATGTTVAYTHAKGVSLSLIMAVPAILVGLILVTIISAGRVEQRLNALLMQMSEKV